MSRFPNTAISSLALKTEDAYFARLFDRHNELDHEIRNMETGVTPADAFAIETLKKEKLLLKDKLYVVLRKAHEAA